MRCCRGKTAERYGLRPRSFGERYFAHVGKIGSLWMGGTRMHGQDILDANNSAHCAVAAKAVQISAFACSAVGRHAPSRHSARVQPLLTTLAQDRGGALRTLHCMRWALDALRLSIVFPARHISHSRVTKQPTSIWRACLLRSPLDKEFCNHAFRSRRSRRFRQCRQHLFR